MYLNKIIRFIGDDFPLIKNMKSFDFFDGLSEEELKYVFSKILGADVERVFN